MGICLFFPQGSYFKKCSSKKSSSFRLSFVSLIQRFAAFLAPLTSGRVTIATSAIYSAKVMICKTVAYHSVSIALVPVCILRVILAKWKVIIDVIISFIIIR